jgi:hypothetical protein
MPGRHGNLSSDQGRFPTVPLLKDFQEIEALPIVQGMRSPVVEDLQLDTGKLADWTAMIGGA